jgi:glycosyltransferase involved in cell wall biosynthesis
LGIKAVVYTPGGAALLRKDISGIKRNLYGYLESFGNLFGGHVVACGQSEANALAHYGVRASVIANGVEVGPIPKQGHEQHAPLKVVSMGRATVQKNPAQFGRIAKALATKGFHFTWIGTGELEVDLPKPFVEMTGWLLQTEAKKLLANSDIYLSTSIWEGLSLAVLEGMSSGLPLVLSACPGNVDVVVPGENGYLFTTDEEAIERLLALQANPSLRLQMGQKSYQTLVAEHNVEDVVKKYELLYKTLARL